MCELHDMNFLPAKSFSDNEMFSAIVIVLHETLKRASALRIKLPLLALNCVRQRIRIMGIKRYVSFSRLF